MFMDWNITVPIVRTLCKDSDRVRLSVTILSLIEGGLKPYAETKSPCMNILAIFCTLVIESVMNNPWEIAFETK